MILIAHDRHLLKSTCDDLYLVDSGQVAPFDGDLDDYHNWLLDQDRQANQDKDTSNDKLNSAVAKKDQKRKEAELRKALSPIKKKADKLVLQQEKMTKRLSEIEEAMADSDLYTESRKSDLNQLLSEQAKLKSELEDVEMQWFEYEEQMEVMRSEYDESN
jgi:ATP-binding cassette subfamily F protein 3